MRGINEPTEPRKAESPAANPNPEVSEPATPEQIKRAKELLSHTHHGEHGNTCISCVGYQAFKSDPLPTNTSEPTYDNKDFSTSTPMSTQYDKVTRFEVIDHREKGEGRVLVEYDVKVQALLQDDGRTLKIRLTELESGDKE